MYRLAAFADEADRTLRGHISAMKDNGIELLEIRTVDGKNIAELTAAEAKTIRKELDGAGIAVWSVGSPMGKIGMTDDFAPHLDVFRHLLELSDILGAGRMRIFSFYHTGLPVTAALRDGVLERLSRFLEEASGSNIILCHENEKGIYGDTASRCADIHRALPALRAVFDPANFANCREDVQAAWELLSPYNEYLHIKDAAEDGTVVPAGEGICNIAGLIRSYRANGGTVMTLEPHLSVFDGFAALERSDGKTNIAARRYASGREAFDAAAAALKNILNG